MALNPILNQRSRQVLYALTREYGDGPLSIHTFGGSTVDLKTGVKSIQHSTTTLKRVIALPTMVKRDLVQTISMISANKQFVYGGTHDARERNFIIDRRQIPNLELKKDDWLVFKGRRYEIVRWQEFEYESGWIVIAKELIGAPTDQVHTAEAEDDLQIDDEAGGTL